MGIRVDLDSLRIARWPESLVDAVAAMQRQAGTGAVRPVQARKLLLTHVHPLCPELGLPERLPPFDLAWSRYEVVGQMIEVIARDRLENCVGSLLIQLPGWVRSRPAPKQQYVFCELCWRHVPPHRRYCEVHDPQLNAAGYRFARRRLCTTTYQAVRGGQRRRAIHSENRLDIRTRELRRQDQVAANEEWARVLAGKLGLAKWLARFRPRVYDYVSNALSEEGRAIEFDTVLAILDDVGRHGQVASLKTAREALADEITKDTDQLMGIMRRAEAWFCLDEEYRVQRPHGGMRENAGRPSG